MIVSHKYAFIFIKTEKTAGTALEVQLNSMLGPDDIATKIFPREPGHKAQNDTVNGIELYNHCPATLVRDAIGPDLFNQYTKFCVEREPVDKCVSYFSMYQNSEFHNEDTKDRTWEEFMAEGGFPTCDDKYLDHDGTLLVDQILRYENLEAELLSYSNASACRFPASTPKQKVVFEPKN
ncbi:MAG: hypothetical protein GKR90_25805 [Pseudomonadales bacterium]|nr:hypothetical protein [Pseudomonadales bacterium]